ncbi:hypothetical protein CN378_18575 [Bacillus sp. AFS015802]|uniref:hypothetical protein n=1 Tax=Bacillus sp. AFS015802 TaxID=2033486 RepID=UPI000BF3D620|nr:hypothetical protein [Bacillus sp. AFS015802]PFA63043.1 hypothetical protein CN378_18575 [Bacillus sp. AFS015802]
MPTTKKENLYFGMMMCAGMVVVMTLYNLLINGLIGTVSLEGILAQLISGFVVAFLLEVFIVGPVAHKMVFSLPFDKSNGLYVILFTSLFMVVGMVSLMSLFGLGTAYFFNGIGNEPILESYLSIASKNFIFALPLQLVIMGPLIRFVFGRLVKRQEIRA